MANKVYGMRQIVWYIYLKIRDADMVQKIQPFRHLCVNIVPYRARALVISIGQYLIKLKQLIYRTKSKYVAVSSNFEGQNISNFFMLK